MLKILEPIPAIDTFTESDWRIKRDILNGTPTVRLLAGPEGPDGKPGAQSGGYWFDNSGLLVKAYFSGIETQRSDFDDFNGVKIARRIDVLKDGHPAMQIRVTDVTPTATVQPETFKLKGHEWQRAFTDEVR